MRDRSVSMEDGGTRSGKREIGAILGCDLGEVEGLWALGSWRDLGAISLSLFTHESGNGLK